MDEPIIIIGAGQAGLKAAETLRQLKFEGSIYLIGEETHPPYQRPPLSKAYLKGEMSAERLFFKSDDFYHDQKIETYFGKKVTEINPSAQTVRLDDGITLSYGKLLIATGTKARHISIPGADLENVVSLRSIDDVAKMSDALKPDMKIALIGAGYIGLEVAASLRGKGHKVTVIEAETRVLARVMSEDMSGFFEKLHTDHGVNILTSARTKAILGKGKVKALQLEDGRTIDCDMVVMAVGALPVDELANGAGLKTDNGIVVDQTCQTSDPNIWAAGDCANFPSKRYGQNLRLESVQNAIDQGKAAAQAMMGEDVNYDPLPWFWSDQYDVKLQIVGLSQGFTRTEIEGDMADNAFSVTYFVGDKPICVDAVNQPRAHMMARRRLA